MGIDDYFLVLILVLGFIFSGLQKLFQRMKAGRQAREQRAGRARDITDDSVRTARRRETAQRPTASPAEPPSIEEVVRRLMGEELVQPVEEASSAEDEEWRPLAPPPIRRAPPQRVPATTPRQMQQPPPRRPAQMPLRPAQQHPSSARPVRQRPARTPAEMMGQPRRRMAEELTPEEIEQRENERRWREEMERRKKQQAAQQAQLAQQQKALPRPRARIMPTHRRLFHSAGEVRRAIILSEVLGPPRSMRGIEERA